MQQYINTTDYLCYCENSEFIILLTISAATWSKQLGEIMSNENNLSYSLVILDTESSVGTNDRISTIDINSLRSFSSKRRELSGEDTTIVEILIRTISSLGNKQLQLI